MGEGLKLTTGFDAWRERFFGNDPVGDVSGNVAWKVDVALPEGAVSDGGHYAAGATGPAEVRDPQRVFAEGKLELRGGRLLFPRNTPLALLEGLKLETLIPPALGPDGVYIDDDRHPRMRLLALPDDDLSRHLAPVPVGVSASGQPVCDPNNLTNNDQEIPLLRHLKEQGVPLAIGLSELLEAGVQLAPLKGQMCPPDLRVEIKIPFTNPAADVLARAQVKASLKIPELKLPPTPLTPEAGVTFDPSNPLEVDGTLVFRNQAAGREKELVPLPVIIERWTQDLAQKRYAEDPANFFSDGSGGAGGDGGDDAMRAKAMELGLVGSQQDYDAAVRLVMDRILKDFHTVEIIDSPLKAHRVAFDPAKPFNFLPQLSTDALKNEELWWRDFLAHALSSGSGALIVPAHRVQDANGKEHDIPEFRLHQVGFEKVDELLAERPADYDLTITSSGQLDQVTVGPVSGKVPVSHDLTLSAKGSGDPYNPIDPGFWQHRLQLNGVVKVNGPIEVGDSKHGLVVHLERGKNDFLRFEDFLLTLQRGRLAVNGRADGRFEFPRIFVTHGKDFYSLGPVELALGFWGNNEKAPTFDLYGTVGLAGQKGPYGRVTSGQLTVQSNFKLNPNPSLENFSGESFLSLNLLDDLQLTSPLFHGLQVALKQGYFEVDATRVGRNPKDGVHANMAIQGMLEGLRVALPGLRLALGGELRADIQGTHLEKPGRRVINGNIRVNGRGVISGPQDSNTVARVQGNMHIDGAREGAVVRHTGSMGDLLVSILSRVDLGLPSGPVELRGTTDGMPGKIVAALAITVDRVQYPAGVSVEAYSDARQELGVVTVKVNLALKDVYLDLESLGIPLQNTGRLVGTMQVFPTEDGKLGVVMGSIRLKFIQGEVRPVIDGRVGEPLLASKDGTLFELRDSKKGVLSAKLSIVPGPGLMQVAEKLGLVQKVKDFGLDPESFFAGVQGVTVNLPSIYVDRGSMGTGECKSNSTQVCPARQIAYYDFTKLDRVEIPKGSVVINHRDLGELKVPVQLAVKGIKAGKVSVPIEVAYDFTNGHDASSVAASDEATPVTLASDTKGADVTEDQAKDFIEALQSRLNLHGKEVKAGPVTLRFVGGGVRVSGDLLHDSKVEVKLPDTVEVGYTQELADHSKIEFTGTLKIQSTIPIEINAKKKTFEIDEASPVKLEGVLKVVYTTKDGQVQEGLVSVDHAVRFEIVDGSFKDPKHPSFTLRIPHLSLGGNVIKGVEVSPAFKIEKGTLFNLPIKDFVVKAQLNLEDPLNPGVEGTITLADIGPQEAKVVLTGSPLEQVTKKMLPGKVEVTLQTWANGQQYGFKINPKEGVAVFAIPEENQLKEYRVKIGVKVGEVIDLVIDSKTRADLIDVKRNENGEYELAVTQCSLNLSGQGRLALQGLSAQFKDDLISALIQDIRVFINPDTMMARVVITPNPAAADNLFPNTYEEFQNMTAEEVRSIQEQLPQQSHLAVLAAIYGRLIPGMPEGRGPVYANFKANQPFELQADLNNEQGPLNLVVGLMNHIEIWREHPRPPLPKEPKDIVGYVPALDLFVVFKPRGKQIVERLSRVLQVDENVAEDFVKNGFGIEQLMRHSYFRNNFSDEQARVEAVVAFVDYFFGASKRSETLSGNGERFLNALEDLGRAEHFKSNVVDSYTTADGRQQAKVIARHNGPQVFNEFNANTDGGNITTTAFIDKSPDELRSYMSDPNNFAQWMPWVDSRVMVDGSHVRGKLNGHPFNIQISEDKRGSLYGVHFQNQPDSTDPDWEETNGFDHLTGHILLLPHQNGGTLVVYESVVDFKGDDSTVHHGHGRGWSYGWEDDSNDPVQGEVDRAVVAMHNLKTGENRQLITEEGLAYQGSELIRAPKSALFEEKLTAFLKEGVAEGQTNRNVYMDLKRDFEMTTPLGEKVVGKRMMFTLYQERPSFVGFKDNVVPMRLENGKPLVGWYPHRDIGDVQLAYAIPYHRGENGLSGEMDPNTFLFTTIVQAGFTFPTIAKCVFEIRVDGLDPTEWEDIEGDEADRLIGDPSRIPEIIDAVRKGSPKTVEGLTDDQIRAKLPLYLKYGTFHAEWNKVTKEEAFKIMKDPNNLYHFKAAIKDVYPRYTESEVEERLKEYFEMIDSKYYDVMAQQGVHHWLPDGMFEHWQATYTTPNIERVQSLIGIATLAAGPLRTALDVGQKVKKEECQDGCPAFKIWKVEDGDTDSLGIEEWEPASR